MEKIDDNDNDMLIEQMMVVKKMLLENPTNNIDYHKMIEHINHFLLKYCNHLWIDDYIDISLEKSKCITYCEYCSITKK